MLPCSRRCSLEEPAGTDEEFHSLTNRIRGGGGELRGVSCVASSKPDREPLVIRDLDVRVTLGLERSHCHLRIDECSPKDAKRDYHQSHKDYENLDQAYPVHLSSLF